MKNINFFVYGSLREGFYNYNKFLDGKIFKKKQGKLHNVKLYHMPYKGYPAIVPGEDYVLGEIMVINKEDYDSTMKALDKMEGFISEGNSENEYHKMLLEVENIENNQNELCYVYFYNKDRDKLFDTEAIYIPNGDWKDYMLNNSII